MTKLSTLKNTLLITTTLTASVFGYGRRAYAFPPLPAICTAGGYASDGNTLIISATGCTLTASITATSSISDGDYNGGTAVAISGDGPITFVDNYHSTFHGYDTGLLVHSVSYVPPPGSISIQLYNNSGVTSAFSTFNYILHPGSGDLIISANGNITGDTGDGVEVNNAFGTGGILVNLSGDISGGTAGIAISNNADSTGTVTLYASGNVYSGYGTGVAVVNAGSNSVSISLTGDVAGHGDGDGVSVITTGADLTISTENVTSSGGQGITVIGSDIGNTSISAQGEVSAGGNAISAIVSSGGDINISAHGNLTSLDGQGVTVIGSTIGDTSISAKGDVNASGNAVSASLSDAGDVNISTTGDLNSFDGQGITISGSTIGDTSISAKGDVNASGNAVSASLSDAGDVNISTTGDLNSFDGQGITISGSTIGDTSISAKGDVNASGNAVSASLSDAGDVNISTTGDLNSFDGQGITISGSTIGDTSISAKGNVNASGNAVSASLSDAGDVNISTTGVLNSADGQGITVSGSTIGDTSISAKGNVNASGNAVSASLSDAGDVNISTTGVLNSADGQGITVSGSTIGDISISADNKITASGNTVSAIVSSGGDINIGTTGALASSGGQGITVIGSTIGDTSISADNKITASGNTVSAIVSSGGDINISATGALDSSGGQGITVIGSTIGDTSISAKGNVNASGNAISAIVSDADDVTINANGDLASSGGQGISVIGSSFGAVSITAGNIDAFSDGISVVSAGTDVTIAAKAGSSISGDGGFGVTVNNGGTGATTITNLKNSEIFGSTAGISVTGGATASGLVSNANKATITGAIGIQVAGNGLSGVGGGINTSGTIEGTDGTAISLTGLTDTTYITINGGNISGNVSDDDITKGFSVATIAGNFTSGGDFTVGDFNVSNGATFNLGEGFTIDSFNTIDIAGIFNINADPTITGNVNVNTKGALNVAADTTITGDLQNNGTLSIATGTLLEANKMSAGAGGTLSFGVTSNTDHGQLTLDSGPGYLTGQTVTIDVAKVNGITLSSAVLLIDGDTALVGGPGKAGAPVTDNSPLWVFKIVDGTASHADFHSGAGASDLYLVVDQSATLNNIHDSIDDTPNNEHAADTLLDLPDDHGPELDEIISDLANSPSHEESHNILESVQPDESGGGAVSTLTFVDNSINLVTERIYTLTENDTGMTGLAAGDTNSVTSGKRVWSQVSGQKASQGFRDNVAGFNSSLMAATVGMDTENLLDNGILGFALSYGNTHVDSLNANRTDTNINSYQGTLYSDYDLGHDYYLNGIVSGAFNTHTTLRHDVGAIPGLNAYGDFNSWQAAARAETGRAFYVGSAIFTPTALVNWVYYKAQGYTETGAGSANLNVGTQALNQLDLGLGIKLSENLICDDGTRLVPEVHAGYRREMLGEKLETSSSFIGGGAAFSGESPDPAQNKFNLGAQMKYYALDNLELTAAYDFDVKQDFTSHTGFLRAGWKF